MKRRLIAPSLFLTLLAPLSAWGEPDLPKVEINGQEYYSYLVKKGDSVYGIAKQFGWDPDELVRANLAATRNLKKGDQLYYPTGKVVVVSTGEGEGVELPFQPITHVVSKGETAYGIAKRYNISLDTLYANHPSAKYGVKAGETIVISQKANTAGENGDFLNYTVRPGDTLFSLAKTYGTNVETLMTLNPGVSDKNFRIGDTVRVPLAKTPDTPSQISVAKPEEVAANDSQTDQGQTQPIAEGQAPAQTAPTPEKEESVAQTMPGQAQEPTVVVSLVLDDPSSKRDSEFVKGFLLALDRYKNAPYKVRVTMEKGADSATAIAKLKEYEPSLVVSTSDRNFPAWLADYGVKSGAGIVNVFDVKSEAYQENPRMMQVLTPSQYFNEEIAAKVRDLFGRRTLLLVGTPDAQDAMATAIKEQMDGLQLELTTEELSDFPLADDEKYLVYVYPTAGGEVEKALNALAEARSKSPLAEVSVLGRPSWVTLTETLGEKFNTSDVYVPSRFFFDFESVEGKDFTEAFSERYGHQPVKSYPLYAAMGYDIANYVVAGAASRYGDYTLRVPAPTPLQTGLDMRQLNAGGGYYNPVCYLVRFTPYGSVEKIVVE